MGGDKFIDDLIVLGRSAPEPISDGRETVCLGGYSPTEGWTRIYPTQKRMNEDLRRWNIVSVPVTKDRSHDDRQESYKIKGSKEDWDKLHTKIEKTGRLSKKEQMELITKLAGDCPATLNKNRQSLGLVDPENIDRGFLKSTSGLGPQLDLSLRERKGKNDYENKLYVEYECKGCEQKSIHKQHTIEWGVYRYWDRNEDKEGVIDALHLNDNDWKKYFFVGNLNNHRTSYIIISILRFKKSEMVRNGLLVNSDETNQATFAEF